VGGGGGVGEAGAQLQAAQHRRVGQVEVAPHLQAWQGMGSITLALITILKLYISCLRPKLLPSPALPPP
jgi:hypothetical protein